MTDFQKNSADFQKISAPTDFWIRLFTIRVIFFVGDLRLKKQFLIEFRHFTLKSDRLYITFSETGQMTGKTREGGVTREKVNRGFMTILFHFFGILCENESHNQNSRQQRV